METLEISFDQTTIPDCSCVLVVPENAVEEPGYIKGLSAQAGGHAKHEFHALAQTAYFQYQDDELEITTMQGPARVTREAEPIELPTGLLVYRTEDGIRAVVHEGLGSKKLLEAAYRFCTRWVRLDI
jgi:hypothetical protein